MADHRPRAAPSIPAAMVAACLLVVTGCTDVGRPGADGPAPPSRPVPPTTVGSVPAHVASTRVEGYPIGLAAARDGGVWVAAARAGSLRHLRVTPRGAEVDGSTRVGEIPLRVVDASSGPWVSVFGAGVLRGLGPRPQVVGALEEPEGLARVGDSLWVVDQARSQVLEVRARAGPPARVVRRVDVGLGPRLVHASRRGVWVSSYSDGSVTRVHGRHPLTRQVCDGPQGLVRAGGRLWVACSVQDGLVGVDPRSLRREVVLDGLAGVDAVASAAGAVLALLPEGPTVVVVDPRDGTEQGRVRLADAAPVVDGNVDLLVHRGRVWASSPTTDQVLSIDLRDLL